MQGKEKEGEEKQLVEGGLFNLLGGPWSEEGREEGRGDTAASGRGCYSVKKTSILQKKTCLPFSFLFLFL